MPSGSFSCADPSSPLIHAASGDESFVGGSNCSAWALRMDEQTVSRLVAPRFILDISAQITADVKLKGCLVNHSSNRNIFFGKMS